MQAVKIDHVHLEVSDRDAAARWYSAVLGLERHGPLAQWAEDPIGPLILQAADGQPAVSLFSRQPTASARDATVAFRVHGADFLDFLERLDSLKLCNGAGEPVGRSDVVDHDLSWSIYFRDPDDNRLEVTTYDHATVAARLGAD